MKIEDRLEIHELISKLAITHDMLDKEAYTNLYTEDLKRSNTFKNTEPEHRTGRARVYGENVYELRARV